MFALDITENRMRILELVKRKESFVLQGLGEREFQTQQQLASLLTELVQTTKPHPITSRDVALAIPDRKFMSAEIGVD